MKLKHYIHRLRTIVDRFPFFAKIYRNHRDSRALSMEPVITPFGFKFIGNEMMQRGEFEPEETILVRSIISNYDSFVNIGANIGYYCCLARAANIETFAFEPIPLNIQYLMRNIDSNNWNSKIEVFPLAMASSPGVVDIYGGGTAASLVKGWANTANHYSTLVPSNTIDSVIGSRLSGKKVLVLMDIEGAEFGALQGAIKLLQQEPKPVWIVEICVHEHQPLGIKTNPNLLDTFDLFWSFGYKAHTATNKNRLVDRAEVLRIFEGGDDTLGTHNFVFSSAT